MTLLTEPAARTGSQLVDEDAARRRFRVHRSAMTSAAIFEQELEQVFAHCWLYVGHESEIPEPGDYVRRPAGGRPVFMVRGVKSGQVNVFHNTCTHRGAVVCRRDRGNAKVFQCFYHAWSFDSEGLLVGVPGRDAYGDDLDMSALGLARVARAESYRGFVFASFDHQRHPGIRPAGQLEAAGGEQHRRLPRRLHSRHVFQVPGLAGHRPQRRSQRDHQGPGPRARGAGVPGSLGPPDRPVGAAVRSRGQRPDRGAAGTAGRRARRGARAPDVRLQPTC